MPHLAALTGLRGVAAWMVVLYHARLLLTDWLPGGVTAMAGMGYLAVDVFFLLSGFVMWLNYGPRLRRDGLAGAPRFWWRRIARIWPLHALVLAGMVAFALVLLAAGRSTAGYPFGELPLHLLLVQNWGFTPDLSWNHPAWSISAELGAYLLFPLVAVSVRWEDMRPAMLIAAMIGAAFALHAVFALAGEPGLGGRIARLGLVRCVLEFAIGVMCANLWLSWRAGWTGALASALAGGVLAALGIAVGWPETAFVPLAFAALLLALALDGGPIARALGSAPLRWLGDASYATYLIHFPLFILVKLVGVDERLQLGPVGFVVYCAVLLALSGALHRWWEKPAQRWLNRRAPRPAAPRVPAE
ncbi:acyltransferase [Aurantiacibacter spongiae]|uniref:Acyltransferase n=1 Tax=Aurantiacibacter spongiae TaxID=2488860 RepID=A0A3N5CU53_9SPHN|nr:acyltransferase [Aurantiacibacter spongiae]